MALTQAEVLTLFSQVSAIKNSDQVLLITANQNGTVSATKITAELLRAYLNGGFEISVSNDGYLVIGGTKTEHRIAGITPQLRRGDYGIECSTDGGTTWTNIAYFSDFTRENVVMQTNETVSIRPNVLNIWGTAISSLTITLNHQVTGQMNEYMMEFTAGSASFTLTLPSGVRWVEEPEWQNGYTYQVSILNGLALYAGWEAPAT